MQIATITILGGEKIFCAKCGATEERFFGYLNKKVYCRRCLIFRGDLAIKVPVKGNADYVMPYPLTPDQDRCANAILKSIAASKSILVHAVCGAGKTEIVYPLIKNIVNNRKYIGIAIPRREVVLELTIRIKEHFPNCHVQAVCGEQTKILTADILILTTHQLFRYPNYFDVLIIDEVDAFPFADNEILQNHALAAAKLFVYLSATPPSHLLNLAKEQKINFTSLYRRYHNFLLPLPKLLSYPKLIALGKAISLTLQYIKKKKQVFIFAPTIELAKKYYSIIKVFIKNCSLVHSKESEKEKIINRFRQQKIAVLITTSILERGVTVKGLQVIVLQADHQLFNKSVLIQIAGRVGRKISDPTGDVIFFGKKVSVNNFVA